MEGGGEAATRVVDSLQVVYDEAYREPARHSERSYMGREQVVEHDEPTLSKLGLPTPATAQVPQAPNALDAAADSPARSEVPTWPGAEERARWMQELGLRQRQRAPAGYVSMLAFGISLGANVVLAGLLGLLWLGQAGAFAPGGATGQPALGGSKHGAALSSPSATPSPVSSLTPGAGWLQVTPSSVQLGCGDGQQTQVVVLENNGPQTVDWQVAFSVPQEQAGVVIDPQQGELDAGASVSVQLQNTTQSTGRHGGSGHQGVIDFAPTTPDAGPSANLAYTTAVCH